MSSVGHWQCRGKNAIASYYLTKNERVINLSLDSALYGDSTKSFVDRASDLALMPALFLITSCIAGMCPTARAWIYALGMSKFISHLKTVLSRNFADRGWSPMVNGKRSRVAAHWEYLVPVEGAFVKVMFNFSRKHFAL
jgi:hypothetical protein